MAYIGRGPTNSGEFIILDDISSGFDGSDTSFTLTVGTTEVTPAAANVTIALDGVIQTATSAYSVTGSTINFTEAPASGQEFHGVLAGQSQYISDSSITNQHISGTANISGSKISTDFGSQNIQIIHVTASGDISVDSMSIPVLSTMSSSVATRFDSRETDMTLATASIALNESNMTLATASIAAITASLGQPVNTDSNVQFADITSTGTITAVEVHTTFVSSSITVASGSNNFGDESTDIHSFTGSVDVSGSLTIDAGNIVFNEDSADYNFRVESNSNTHALFVDGGTNRVSIGDSSPGSPLDVKSSEAANTANFNSTNGATNITLESNGSLIGQMEFSGPGPSQIVTRTTASLALGSNNVKSVFITDDDRVGIGTDSPSHLLHVNAADGASDNTQAMTIENNETTDGRSYGLKIKAGSNASDAPLFVQDHDASNDFFIIRGNGATGVGTTAPSNKFVVSNAGAGGIEFNPGDSTSSMVVFNRGTSSYISYLVEAGKITFAPQGTNPVVIDQGANDGEALSLKSSDVSHPQTNTTEADTYGRMLKASSTGGGLRIDGFNDANNIAVEMVGNAQGDSQGRATDTNGPIVLRGVKTSGNDPGDLPSNSNILVVANRNTVRFIFDSDGDFHADNSSTTFDQYNDSQLVRAFDLSHGRGVIQSKFDDFVNYQHETLASLKLVGREKDGTPNNFVNVTGMQRLHNGAIWQQYTEMEKMKELMYDTMVELIGKEQADKKLEKHDIKLLDESLDVTDSLWSRTKNKVKSLFKVVKD